MLQIGGKYLLIIFLSAAGVYSQLPERVKLDTIHLQSNLYKFSENEFLIDSIYSIKICGTDSFIYSIKFQKSSQSIFIESDSLIGRSLIITYYYLPIKREKFQKNIPVVKQTEAIERKIVIEPKLLAKNFSDELFTRNLERSGSFVRGFSVGSNRDFTLNSALRLQMAGKLSEDIEVVAVLSDQSSPIQPEGNTRTLQEIDNVFIELKHKNAQATFGDFHWNYKFGTFNLVDKKLQGLRLQGLIDQNNYATISYASSRGKFKSQQFNGQDGVQGPYKLTGENNKRDIIVIAGTEKVFINGEQKTRGANYDYTIDYSTGEIFFNPKVVITNSTRIRVDFEYSDREYDRNFFGTLVESNLFNENIRLGLSYFRDGDNQNSPIDVILTDNDRKILEQSGNDKFLATKNGVRFVGVDSTGRPLGIYKLKDTVINNNSFKYYEFAPGDDSAFYNITFSFVGDGKGDYKRIGAVRFKFVGVGNGEYLPIVLLPMPELKQVVTLNSFVKISKNLRFNGEYSYSSFDNNRFSKIGDELNRGIAYTFTFGVDTLPMKFFNKKIGDISISLTERNIDSTYSNMGRIYDVEFERDWNLTFFNISGKEKFRNLTTRLDGEKRRINLSLGKLQKGSSFNSNKIDFYIEDELVKNTVLTYLYSKLHSSKSPINSRWNRHHSTFLVSKRKIKPSVKIEYEDKKDFISTFDSLLNSSFRFFESTVGFGFDYIKYLDIISTFSFRHDELPLRNILTRESNSLIYQLSLKTKSFMNFNSSLDIAYRQKKYFDDFKSLGRLDNNSLALKLMSRGSLFKRFFYFDLFYEASSQRSARLEKIFVRVQKGNGNYIYRGDINKNGLADEFEFEPTRFEGDYILMTYPTDELFPATDLKSSIRVKLIFENLQGFSTIKALLKPLSLETYLRVEETSKDENTSNIYLIRIKKFQNPNLTLRGSKLIQQDLNFWENNPTFNGMVRFIERKSLTIYNITSEHRFYQEQLVRIRFRPLKEFANQTELNRQKNILTSSGYRNFTINSLHMNSKIFYYPYSSVEVSFKVEVGRSLDYFPVVPLEAVQNSQQLTLNYIYSRQGRISMEFERTEININRTNEYIPFELLRGYLPGKNFLWRLLGDYQIANNLQANFIYDGRLQGKGNPIHSAQAEIRAYF